MSPAARIADQRASTAELEAALSRAFADIVEANAGANSDDEHDPDGATIAFERAQIAALLDAARAELDALDEARQRIIDGTYGTCVRCGLPIHDDRLDVLPATTTCVTCA
jgi:RNA polymerase-binding transcription factor DksA